mgnify:CR=1 FL=1
MKNVVVFTWAGRRRAIELRWVREIITLGPIAAAPGAPPCIAGATNYHGSVLPILVPEAGTSRPRAGDPAIVVEVGDLTAALATEGIGEVTTLRENSDAPESDELIDASGSKVDAVQLAALVDAAVTAIAATRRLPEPAR